MSFTDPLVELAVAEAVGIPVTVAWDGTPLPSRPFYTSDLAQVVRLDAPLSAKIIRLANSPFYGARSDVADISRCIAVLGYRTTRNVAITLTVVSYNLLGDGIRDRLDPRGGMRRVER